MGKNFYSSDYKVLIDSLVYPIYNKRLLTIKYDFWGDYDHESRYVEGMGEAIVGNQEEVELWFKFSKNTVDWSLNAYEKKEFKKFAYSDFAQEEIDNGVLLTELFRVEFEYNSELYYLFFIAGDVLLDKIFEKKFGHSYLLPNIYNLNLNPNIST